MDEKTSTNEHHTTVLQQCMRLHNSMGISIRAVPTQQDILGAIERLHKCLDLLAKYDPMLHTLPENKHMYRVLSDILRAVAIFHAYKTEPHIIQALFDWFYIDGIFEVVETLEMNRSDIEDNPSWGIQPK